MTRTAWMLGCAIGMVVLGVAAPRAAAQTSCLRDSTARAIADSASQHVGTPDSAASARGASVRDASVVIFAAVSAREVRFAKQPTVHVRLCGSLDSVHVVDRRNLPSPVVAGTTYQNVYVAVEIFGRLNADCLARELTRGGAALDCAALDLRGTSTTSRPPADTSRSPRS